MSKAPPKKAKPSGKSAKKPPAHVKPSPKPAPRKAAEKEKAAPRPAVAAPPTKSAAPKPAGAPASAAASQRPGHSGRPGAPPKKSGRRALAQRRGPDGELLAPGEILLPGGPHTMEEILYLFRGSVAAEHPVPAEGVSEVLAKRPLPDPEGAVRAELTKHATGMEKRFESGTIEAMLPARPPSRGRTFQGVVERAKLRRREIGSFLRGLHLGRQETSHMDSHGEDSLQKLMEWAARLENLVESDEPEQADYAQFHRGLDQLENTTEALIIDVEQTLRRLRDRNRTKMAAE